MPVAEDCFEVILAQWGCLFVSHGLSDQTGGVDAIITNKACN